MASCSYSTRLLSRPSVLSKFSSRIWSNPISSTPITYGAMAAYCFLWWSSTTKLKGKKHCTARKLLFLRNIDSCWGSPGEKSRRGSSLRNGILYRRSVNMMGLNLWSKVTFNITLTTTPQGIPTSKIKQKTLISTDSIPI